MESSRTTPPPMPIIETIRALPITGLVNELIEEHPDSTVERARTFYRKQMENAFAVSAAILSRTPYHRGRTAWDALDAKTVAPFLEEAELGRLESARNIGEQAVARMWTLDPSGALSPLEWWRNLLDYEFALFLQLATDPLTRPVMRPLRGTSATLRVYMWDIRATVLKAGPLSDPMADPQTGQEISRKQSHAEGLANIRLAVRGDEFDPASFAPAIPGDRSHRLLFSRDAANQVNISEITAPEAALFREVNGKRTIAELAQETGQNEKDVRFALKGFAESGAVLMPER